jgi:hypothetical protein
MEYKAKGELHKKEIKELKKELKELKKEHKELTKERKKVNVGVSLTQGSLHVRACVHEIVRLETVDLTCVCHGQDKKDKKEGKEKEVNAYVAFSGAFLDGMFKTGVVPRRSDPGAPSLHASFLSLSVLRLRFVC